MSTIKIIFFFLLFFSLSKTYAIREYKLNFNTDIMVCKDGVFSLTFIEQRNLYPDSKLDFLSPSSDQNFYHHNLSKLYDVSPQRTHFIIDLIDKKVPNISYKNQIKLARVSPQSALIIPAGCQVEPLSLTQITFAPHTFITYINNDFLQKMDPTNQFLSLMELSLNIEQAIHSLSLTYADPILVPDISFDLVISREFLRCWYSSLCRPKDPTLPQAHQIFKKYNLSFIEQAGFLIPSSKASSTHPNGIVAYIDATFIVFPPLASYFRSLIQIRNNTLDLSGYINLKEGMTKTIIFSHNGNIHCLPIDDSITTFIGSFNKLKYPFVSSPYYKGDNPVCLNRNGQVTQGFIPFSSLIEIPFSNTFVQGVLSSWDDYNVRDFGSFIRMYDNGEPQLLYFFKGKGLIQNKTRSLFGPLKLRVDGSIECARIAEPVNLQTNTMQIHHHDPNTKNLLCFDDQQLLDTIITPLQETLLIDQGLPSY